MMMLQRVLMILVLTVTGTLGYFYMEGQFTEKRTVEIGAPFKLASAKGGVIDSSTLAGQPYGVFFGFTHCPEVCPTTLYEMTNLLDGLGDEAKNFRMFFVTVDPERDTVKELGDYMSSFDPRMEGLVPTREQLPEITRSFRVIYEKVPTTDGSYTMNHTATVFLFDKQGKFAGTIAWGEGKNSRKAKVSRLIGS
jgi:protein SCO1